MKNKQTKSEHKKPCPEVKHIFEHGDIISDSSKKDVRLILKAENRIYYCLQLKPQYIKDVFGTVHVIEKGSETYQPADIVERNFYIVEI